MSDNVNQHDFLCPCCEGLQSPINIEPGPRLPFPEEISVALSLGEIGNYPHLTDHPLTQKLDASGKRAAIRNPNYNVIQVDNPSGTVLAIRNGETQYEGTLQQYHFHFRSEHRFDGKQAAGEVHFVFKDENNKITVIAVPVQENTPDRREEYNPVIQHIIHQLKEPTPSMPAVDYSLEHLLPLKNGKLDVYAMSGSLTVPDADDNFGAPVNWFVSKEPIYCHSLQALRMMNIAGGRNARSTQPVNGRTIYAGELPVDASEGRFTSLEVQRREDTGLYPRVMPPAR